MTGVQTCALPIYWKPDSPDLLRKLKEYFSKYESPVKDDYEYSLKKTAEELNIGKGKLIHPLRLAVSGMSTGPGMFDLLDVLGKDEVLRRIDRALDRIK